MYPKMLVTCSPSANSAPGKHAVARIVSGHASCAYFVSSIEPGVTCRWTNSLGACLNYLRKHFVARLYYEHLPAGDTPDDDVDEEGDPESEAMGEDDAPEQDAEMTEPTSIGKMQSLLLMS